MPHKTITFEDFDALKLGEFGKKLTTFISIERHFVDGALTLSLSGKFGCGKSTFFEMWRNQIATEEEPKFDTISLNAWNSDFLRDPLLSIVSSLVDYLGKRNPKKAQKIKSLAGWVARFSAAALNDLTKAAVIIDPKKAVEAAEESPEKRGMKCFETFKQRRAAFERLKGLLGETAEQAKRPLIVIVDELDRCRPDYAVEYLEVIKHIFDIKNLVFILGIDRDSMASSVGAMFGSKMSFDEYFRKFVHRNVTLPFAELSNLAQFARDLWKHYLDSGTIKRHIGRPVCTLDNGLDHKLLKTINLTPRQLHEAIRVSVHALHNPDSRPEVTTGQIAELTYAMAFLSVGKSDLYHRIGAENSTVADTLDLLAIFKEDQDFWSNPSESLNLWFVITSVLFPSERNYELVSEGIFTRKLARAADHLRQTAASALSSRFMERRIQGFPDRASSYQTTCRQIYLKLESVGTFAD